MNLALAESTQEKVPSVLEDILKRISSDEKSTNLKQTDIFLVLLIVLLSENGFFLVADNQADTIEPQCLQLIDNKHLSKWKISTGVYELSFVLGGFSDSLIKLMLCPLGISSLINVVISDISPEVYSVCFPVSRYVVDPEASTIPMMFNDLKHLSDTFKTRIITPLKSTLLNHYGYSSASLVGLPEELIINILLYLPISNIINVAKTCRKLSLLLNNECFWHKLFLRDISSTKVSLTDCQEYKTLYRDMYTWQENSRNRVRCRTGSFCDYLNVCEYYSFPTNNPMWNVMF
ncbi:F-box only protein 7-like [Maniola jurtina]|uniref:F-box only protein 7-like n=1 Tax=Maniola jurtina TaxID=191418 RepID=UPI001E688F6B|nr:F-box only protein 7-like [Maniola jurtina]